MDREKLLSMDPYMLLSLVNMKLRDEFINLKDLCSYYGIKNEDLKEKLKKVDYEYNEKNNQFV
ncbi:DUF4250 domain-containing protein [Clostridium sp. BJN0001]|uniref:DUF4250 domain-containing protein n=1 Tax=Clostridium sp. BJN0001 TaxID=2930219 RepID=UPI001FD00E8E|nr:DUF4250 domain-containing protein [Clostridium sp. BJN0001]